MDEHLVFLALAKRREDVAHHGILEGDDIEVGIITYLFDIRDGSPSAMFAKRDADYKVLLNT